MNSKRKSSEFRGWVDLDPGGGGAFEILLGRRVKHRRLFPSSDLGPAVASFEALSVRLTVRPHTFNKDLFSQVGIAGRDGASNTAACLRFRV